MKKLKITKINSSSFRNLKSREYPAVAEKKSKAKKEPKLTAKQKAFCEEYMIDLNATQAAIRAGYKPDNAQQMSTENLLKPVIKDYIEQLMDKRSEITMIDSYFVIENLKNNVNRCMQSEPVLDNEGLETGEYQFNAAGANKALELLGKHLGLFVERKEHSGPNGTPVKMDNIFEFIPVNNSN